VWIAVSAVLPPVFLLGVTSRRLTARGAIIAMLAGLLATLPVLGLYVWTRFDDRPGTLSFIVTSAPALIVPLVVGYAWALFCPRLSDERLHDLTLFTLGAKHEHAPPREDPAGHAALGTETA